MAKISEKIDDLNFEIQLPGLFSKMKVSIDGREVAVGSRSKGGRTASFAFEDNRYEVRLKTRFPEGYTFSLSKNEVERVSRPITKFGVAVDPRLANVPKWMFVFPILSGIPIFLHGLLPAGIGALGAGVAYKIVASYQADRKKLVVLGIVNVLATYGILALALWAFGMGMVQLGWMKHNVDYLKSSVEKTNKALPLKLDPLTTLKLATYEKDTLTLHYTVEPLDLVRFDRDAFLAKMRATLVAASCKDENTRNLLKNDFWVEYKYTSNSFLLGSVKVSEADCGK